MPDETPDPTDEDSPATDHFDESATDGSESLQPTGDDDPDTPPPDVVDEAERLTRLAREARERESPSRDAAIGSATGHVDESEPAAYLSERDDLLGDHGYHARVREDDSRDVLVLHPDEWVEEGTVRTERIDDVDRGIEIPLSGPGEGDDWDVVDEHNRDLVAAVREAHGDVHADNAAALADFMSNHYAKPIESATTAELREFLDDYFPRNAWPTAEQRSVVERSVVVTFEVADERCPIDP